MKLRRTPDIDSIVMLKLFQHLSCRLVLASLDSRTVRQGNSNHARTGQSV